MAEPLARLPSSLFTVRNVADLLKVRMETVKRIPPAELPYSRAGARGDRRYAAEDVAAYLKLRRVDS